jgi:hypothetical protein
VCVIFITPVFMQVLVHNLSRLREHTQYRILEFTVSHKLEVIRIYSVCKIIKTCCRFMFLSLYVGMKITIQPLKR